MGAGGQESDRDPRGEMSISSVVQRVEMPQADSETCNRYDQDAEAPGRFGGGLSSRAAYTPLQGAEEYFGGDQTSTGLPVPPAPVSEREHNLGIAQLALPQFDLAAGPGSCSASQSEGESLGHFLGQILEDPGSPHVKWPLPQEEVKGTLVALRLINPDNLCFVHATILAFFWGFIHLRHAKWNDLGGAARLLMDLCSRSSLWVDVRDIDCWGDWLACWGDGRQHDAHEFLKAFLNYTQPPALTGSWVRKMSSEGKTTIMDYGSASMPPSLATSNDRAEKVSLQTLINEWHTYMGMITAFETDSPLICFQLDRFRPDFRGKVEKASWTLELTMVEILVSPDRDSLHTETYEYLPIAGILHRGHDQRGHLQCVGRTRQGWIVFEDGIEASVHPSGRPPRPEDWICVWLLRATRAKEVTPSYYVRDHAAKVHQLVLLLDQKMAGPRIQRSSDSAFLNTLWRLWSALHGPPQLGKACLPASPPGPEGHP